MKISKFKNRIRDEIFENFYINNKSSAKKRNSMVSENLRRKAKLNVVSSIINIQPKSDRLKALGILGKSSIKQNLSN